jgi:hypothetical protein
MFLRTHRKFRIEACINTLHLLIGPEITSNTKLTCTLDEEQQHSPLQQLGGRALLAQGSLRATS